MDVPLKFMLLRCLNVLDILTIVSTAVEGGLQNCCRWQWELECTRPNVRIMKENWTCIVHIRPSNMTFYFEKISVWGCEKASRITVRVYHCWRSFMSFITIIAFRGIELACTSIQHERPFGTKLIMLHRCRQNYSCNCKKRLAKSLGHDRKCRI